VRLAIRKGCLLTVAATVSAAFLSLTAGCQSRTAPAPASPTALTPYTAPDQSASAGIPSGWQVVRGQQTAIAMTGPGGVSLTLGATFIAKNAPFQLGQKGSNGIDLTMPYSATLAQKFGMIVEQGAAIGGTPISQFAVASTTPLQLPPTLGQCSRFIAGYSASKGPMKIMAVFCSLPLDPGGDYKNIMLYAEAPSTTAAQVAPVAQSVFQSYRIPTDWLQRKLAPVNGPAPGAATGGTNSAATTAMNNARAAAIMQSTTIGVIGANNSANCFDLGVLRQTPTYELPRSCGGTKPD